MSGRVEYSRVNIHEAKRVGEDILKEMDGKDIINSLEELHENGRSLVSTLKDGAPGNGVDT